MSKKKTKIFLDFDGVISDSITTIVRLYNEDYKDDPCYIPIKPEDINTWGFKECNCATTKEMYKYFEDKRFFENIEFMTDTTYYYIKLMAQIFDVIICSAGTRKNLRLKEEFIKKIFPKVKFLPVNSNKYKDKSHINMTDGIFVDDSAKNLVTSNAEYKICYGKQYPWNEQWKGIRVYDWYELWTYIYTLTE